MQRRTLVLSLALALLAGSALGDDARPTKAEKGKLAPALSVIECKNTTGGREPKLEDLAGKTVLILFVGVWDDACKEVAPRLKKLARGHSTSLVVIGIHTRGTARKMAEVMKEEGLEWPCCLDDGTAERYGVKDCPVIALIDAKGVLVALAPSKDVKDADVEKLVGPPEERAAEKRPAAKTARELAARAQIANFELALDIYEVDNGCYPTTAQGLDALHAEPTPAPKGWKGPYLKREVPKDPWGNAYHYRCPGEHAKAGYDLWSNGADGKEGTDDDIRSWAEEEKK